jgi:putative membrane protein
MVDSPAHLSAEDRVRIRDAIAEAESSTSGEVFVVVAGESDDYRFVPLVWAALAALALPLPLIWLTPLSAGVIFALQLAAFILLAVGLSLPRIKPAVIPRSLKQLRVRALAEQQFLAHGLHTTEARTGILIFVSLAERQAEIVADAGIAAKVEQGAWDGAMADLVAAAGADRLGDGLVAAVRFAGEVLARHFPPYPHDRDELANDVVLL